MQRNLEERKWSEVPNTSPPAIPCSHHSLMIIDDSSTIRKIVETGFGREGYEVTSFADGIAALQWLAGPDARLPELLLLDVNLPRMNGYDVARYLQKKYPYIIIVMLTRRDGMLDKLKARLAGAQDYLVKPFQMEVLLTLVAKYVRSDTLIEKSRTPC
jgi:twitching motility two-component system response regulator PilG